MAEQGGISPEVIRPSETPKKYQEQYIALDVRLMMTPKATEDPYTDFVDVTKKLQPEDILTESLGVVDMGNIETNMDQREIYDRIGNASTRQRRQENAAGPLGSEQFNQKLDEWSKGFYKTLTGKDMTDASKSLTYSQDWNTFFDKFISQSIGKDITRANLSVDQTKQLYDRYFKGQEKVSDPRAFAKDIVLMYKKDDGTVDQEAINANIEKVQLVARIFGDFGDEVIAHAIKSEVAVYKNAKEVRDRAVKAEPSGELAANTFRQPVAEQGKTTGHTEEELHKWIIDKGKPLMESKTVTTKPDDSKLKDGGTSKKEDETKVIKRKMTDELIAELQKPEFPKQPNGLLALEQRFNFIDLAKYPPAKPEDNPYFVDVPPSQLDLNPQQLSTLEETRPYFVGQSDETGVDWVPNPEVSPFSSQLGDVENGIASPRFMVAQATTDRQSNLFALAADSSSTPESQAQLYKVLAETILKVHRNNPDLLKQWYAGQGQEPSPNDESGNLSSIAGFRYFDQGVTEESGGKFFIYREESEDGGVPVDKIDLADTDELWKTYIPGIEKALRENKLSPAHLRWIDFLSRSVKIPEVIKLIKEPPQTATETTEARVQRTKKMTDEEVETLNKNQERQAEGIIPVTERFAFISMTDFPPNLSAENPFVVFNPPDKIEATPDELKELEAPVPFFIPLSPGSMTPNPIVNPHTHILGNGDSATDRQPGMRDPRFLAAEASTNDDSGIFALAAASAETPEKQAQLYIAMVDTIVQAHKNNPDLLRKWLEAQGTITANQADWFTTSAGVFKTYDMRLPLPQRHLWYQADGQIDIDRTVEQWRLAVNASDISVLRNEGLNIDSMRNLEFLAHSIKADKLIELIRSKSQTPPSSSS